MRERQRRDGAHFAWGVGLVAIALVACPAPPAAGAWSGSPDAPPSALSPADENLRVLIEIGAREVGSPSLARARSWAEARLAGAGGAARLGAPAAILLAAPLDTEPASGATLAEQSTGAAAVLAAATVLSADEPALAVGLALLEGRPGSPEWQAALGAHERLSEADLVIYVNRACGLPARRDLLSHRVLRERFLRSAGIVPEPGAFEQAPVPHAELEAAGAQRVVGIDAPAREGECSPAALGDALVRFVRDASELLARNRSARDGAAPVNASAGFTS